MIWVKYWANYEILILKIRPSYLLAKKQQTFQPNHLPKGKYKIANYRNF